jgi:thioredoxin 2
MESVLLRCQSCGAVNRVLKDKLSSVPKCGRCKKPLDYPHEPIDITTGSFKKEVLSSPGVVLVDFWSPTCGHCQRLNPVLDQIAAEKAGAIKIAKVNTKTDQHLAFQFGIRGVPTLILYKNGKKINEISGALPKHQLEAWINSSLA